MGLRDVVDEIETGLEQRLEERENTFRTYLSRRAAAFRTKHPRKDVMAGVVLGVESVPDGLAQGLLAGVNPVAGLYGYLYGTVGGAFVSGTAMMAVQGTSAMSIIVAEQNIGSGDGAVGKLAALSLVTGVFMLLAAFFNFASLLRYVSTAVMTGFASAVGVNIVLGQLSGVTGYESDAPNRLFKGFDTLAHVGQFDRGTLAIGVGTIVLIVLLNRTRLGAMGLVVAVIITSALTSLGGDLFKNAQLLGEIASVSDRLPWATLPDFGAIPGFILPGLALTLVGLIQGAAITAAYPSETDGMTPPETADFAAQGAGNIATSLFRGIPVGGSFSASQLVAQAGATSRIALFVCGGVMAAVVLFFGSVIGYVAMPALAGLLLYIGVTAVHVRRIVAACKTGTRQAAALILTLFLTTVIPLQWAVLIGVAVSMQAEVVRQANQLLIRQLHFTDDNRIEETEPIHTLPADSVVVLQHYGGLFFASANAFRDQLPRVTAESKNSVVILRTRGIDEVGATVAKLFQAYLEQLKAVDSKLVIVTNNERFHNALQAMQVVGELGRHNLYRSDRWLFETTRAAYADAQEWIDQQRAHAPAKHHSAGGDADRDDTDG